MSYTTVRVTERGIMLYAGHARRLAPHGGPLLDAFRRFAADAPPGIYALRAATCGLEVVSRRESHLFDGMPARTVVSPYSGGVGRHTKPAPPSAYASVRVPGTCTLLTDAAGSELLESCTAALIAWDGARYVVPPPDRPRVASVAEQAVLAAFAPVERPLTVDGEEPLLVVNAVKGACTPAFGRAAFPPEARARLERLFEALTRRP